MCEYNVANDLLGCACLLQWCRFDCTGAGGGRIGTSGTHAAHITISKQPIRLLDYCRVLCGLQTTLYHCTDKSETIRLTKGKF